MLLHDAVAALAWDAHSAVEVFRRAAQEALGVLVIEEQGLITVNLCQELEEIPEV